VPKVTIYRIGKFQEGSNFEVLIKFANPNMSIAKIQLSLPVGEDLDEELNLRLTAEVELPKDIMLIDPQDSLNDP